MTRALPVHQLIEQLGRVGLGVDTVEGEAGTSRSVTTAHLHRPGLSLVGHFFHYHPERVQVFGETEMTFLEEVPGEERRRVLSRLAADGVPCFVVTKGQPPYPEMLEVCAEHQTPLLVTPEDTGQFIRGTSRLLGDLLAPTTYLHGVMVDVLGVGVMLIGPSGIGKSECALELVLRGHRLVADDSVEVRLRPPDHLICRAQELIKHHMEIRGLGIINIQDLFGVAAVRDQKRLELVIELVPWDPEEEYDRVGIDGARTKEILGVGIDLLQIPVRPGRNLSEVIEVAARNILLKLRGVDSARRFQETLINQIASASPTEEGAGASPKGRPGRINDDLE